MVVRAARVRPTAASSCRRPRGGAPSAPPAPPAPTQHGADAPVADFEVRRRAPAPSAPLPAPGRRRPAPRAATASRRAALLRDAVYHKARAGCAACRQQPHSLLREERHCLHGPTAFTRICGFAQTMTLRSSASAGQQGQPAAGADGKGAARAFARRMQSGGSCRSPSASCRRCGVGEQEVRVQLLCCRPPPVLWACRLNLPSPLPPPPQTKTFRRIDTAPSALVSKIAVRWNLGRRRPRQRIVRRQRLEQSKGLQGKDVCDHHPSTKLVITPAVARHPVGKAIAARAARLRAPSMQCIIALHVLRHVVASPSSSWRCDS